MPAGHLLNRADAIAERGVWAAWQPDPFAVAGVTAMAVAYVFALHALAMQGHSAAVPGWRRLAFAVGIAALVVALVSPLELLSGVLLWAHMLQHILLISVAAPLIAYGAPPLRMASSLAPAWRRRLLWMQTRLTGPGLASVLRVAVALALIHTVAVWIWHVPALYELTLRSDLAHMAEHGVFFVTAWLVWAAVFAFGARSRASAGLLLVLFGLAAQGSALGAAMAFSSRPWYSAYTDRVAGGLDPLIDQQIAGLIMWGAGALAPVAVVALLLSAWLRWDTRHPRVNSPVKPDSARIGPDPDSS